MAKGIEIGIASETKAFKLGVESGIIAPVEEAVDALDDLGKSRGPDQLERGLKDAQDATEKLQKETKQTADIIEREFRQAGRKLGDDVEAGTKRAGRGMDDLKSETQQSLRETAASIREVGDGLDAVQEIAANAFIGFGPAGFVAGATAAAGLGLVSSAIESAQEDANELKEALVGAFQAAAEEGRNYLDEAQIIAAANDLIFDTSKRQQAQKEAAAIGLDVQTYIRAMVGDQEALTAAINASADAQAAAKAQTEGMVGAQGEALEAYNSQYTITSRINSQLEAQQKLIDDNVQAANLALTIHGQDNETIQKMNKSLAETPKSVPVKLTVDDSAISAALYRRTLRIDVEGYTRNGQRVV